MTPSAAVAVMGLGVWMPGIADARAWHDNAPRTDAEAPPARLPIRLRRRTSLLIRMVAEVAAQAAEQAHISLGAVPIVVGSAFGELTTTMEMLHELATDRAVSPFRFHNSVHNTASGYLSIAHDNHHPATSIAAGNDTTAMVLLEAMARLAAEGGDVLAIVADESLPEALGGRPTPSFAAAMILRATDAHTPAAPDALAWLDDLRQIGASRADERNEERNDERDDDSPCRTFLRLIAATLDARTKQSAARVELTAGSTPRWSITVTPGR